MKLEEFKEKIRAIEIVDNRWKNKMMSVVKLYKSLGYGLNDILDKENTLFDKIYLYMGEVIEKIIDPPIEQFYTYMFLQKNMKQLKDTLTPDTIRKLLLKDFEKFNTAEEYILAKVYSKCAYQTAIELLMNSKFSTAMCEYLLKNHNVKSKKEFLQETAQTNTGAIEHIYEFISGDLNAQKSFGIVFMERIKEEEKELRVDIKESLILRIITIVDFFNKCGYLEEVMETNNNAMNKHGIPMNVAIEDTKADFDLRNLTTPKYFEQFSHEELFVLSAFYCNRLEKIIENIYDGMYLHIKLDSFYDTVAYGELPRNIDSSDAKMVLKQKYFIEALSKNEFKNLKDVETIAEDEVDFNYVPPEFIEQYGKVYNDYFDRYIHTSQNTLEEDYKFIFISRGISYCMYTLKDFSIESLLYTLSQNKSKINFGLIKEDRTIVNEYGEEQVLIGVDYKEFPTIRLHFPKKDFEEFNKHFFSNDDFPKYIGNNDFSVNGTEITTQILYKFTKKQKQAIKKAMDEEKKKDEFSDKYRFLRHMYENIHPNQNPLNSKKKNKNDLDEI